MNINFYLRLRSTTTFADREHRSGGASDEPDQHSGAPYPRLDLIWPYFACYLVNAPKLFFLSLSTPRCSTNGRYVYIQAEHRAYSAVPEALRDGNSGEMISWPVGVEKGLFGVAGGFQTCALMMATIMMLMLMLMMLMLMQRRYG